MPQGLKIEPKAIVLKSGGGSASAVTALETRDAAKGSLVGNNSPEMLDLEATRQKLYERLGELREGGLSKQAPFPLLRTRAGGDTAFLARACGIPADSAAALDQGLESYCGSFFESNTMPAVARPQSLP